MDLSKSFRVDFSLFDFVLMSHFPPRDITLAVGVIGSLGIIVHISIARHIKQYSIKPLPLHNSLTSSWCLFKTY